MKKRYLMLALTVCLALMSVSIASLAAQDAVTLVVWDIHPTSPQSDVIDQLNAEFEEALDVSHAAHASAVTDRHEGLRQDLLHMGEVRGPPLGRRVDVQQDQLVHFLVVEDADRVDRVADVASLAEPHGLHEAAVREQEDRDDPRARHRGAPTKFRNSWIPNR